MFKPSRNRNICWQLIRPGIVLIISLSVYACASAPRHADAETDGLIGSDLSPDDPGIPAAADPEKDPAATEPEKDSAAADSTAVPHKIDETDLPQLPVLPPVPREFRGVWVTTVNNGDWPSRMDLTTAEQQEELRAIMDRAKLLNLNTIIFQIRPTADAMYASALEPWSIFLTGQQGKAPEPYYDPLQFAIEEAHLRGLELHAWFNPFRASFGNSVAEYDSSHVALSGMVVRYGRHLWLDPGNPDARVHSLKVVLDVVRRYDIDGVHVDDYFYPYPVAASSGKRIDFPDDSSWARSVGRAEGLSRSDWRRRNVDEFVQTLYNSVQEIKPWVLFGISPFGIWKPGYPEGIEGFNAYDALYADSRKWLLNGWLDYISPQLYWADDAPAQSYSKLLAWWIEQNPMGRHIWPGNFASRITLRDDQFWTAEELLDQIAITRGMPHAGGNTLFRMGALMPAVHRLGDQLREKRYQTPALVPESQWKTTDSLPTLSVAFSRDKRRFRAELKDMDSTAVGHWLVWELRNGVWDLRIHPGGSRVLAIGVGGPTGGGAGPGVEENSPESSDAVTAVAVSVVGRTGRESVVVFERLIQEQR